MGHVQVLKYLQSCRAPLLCAPLGRAAAATARHGSVELTLMIGSQGACHHGDWHVSLWMLGVHVQPVGSWEQRALCGLMH